MAKTDFVKQILAEEELNIDSAFRILRCLSFHPYGLVSNEDRIRLIVKAENAIIREAEKLM